MRLIRLLITHPSVCVCVCFDFRRAQTPAGRIKSRRRMSSYFVNSLALCYSDEVADSGGGQPQQQTQPPTQREYRHGASPYRSYPTGHHSYPYNTSSSSSSDTGAKRHDDFYVNDRAVPQRATSRNSTASPPAESMASAAATTATDYSPTATAYRAGHMSPAETSARRTASSPPPRQPTPPPKHALQSRASTPSPVSVSQESPQQPTSTPMPTQIFPWMRRMHLGHGKLCCFAIARCQLCCLFFVYMLCAAAVIVASSYCFLCRVSLLARVHYVVSAVQTATLTRQQ